jgi:predicted O-methyltransferase YrrM
MLIKSTTSTKTIPLDLRTAPGYQVLAAAGKKVLRPGGSTATRQLLNWANFQPGQTVLELAASFGCSAIALAKRYNVQVVGVEKDAHSVACACENIAAAGLSGQVQVVEGDIFHLDQISGQFDYVLAEAILTLQSASGKAKVLSEVRDRLKPGGCFLSHELVAGNRVKDIQQDLSRVARISATPLCQQDWIDTFTSIGFTVQQHQTGSMALLKPSQILVDEGIIGSFQIAWNILTQPVIRDRVMQMRQMFQQYRPQLGYIITLCRVIDDQ